MEASLYAAFLSQTTWLRCRGRQADFEAAELVETQFLNCDLNNTKCRRDRLSSAIFEDTLLIGVELRKMSFRKTQLQQLDFSEADMSGCDFSDAIFMGGSLRNAHLKLTRFALGRLRTHCSYVIILSRE